MLNTNVMLLEFRAAITVLLTHTRIVILSRTGNSRILQNVLEHCNKSFKNVLSS